MLRVASILAVIFLGTLAGCRSIPPASVADDRSGAGATHTTPISAARKTQLGVRSVTYVPDAEGTDESEAQSDSPEVLSSASSASRAAAPLTLTDLEGIAIQNNPTMAAAAARIEAARGRQLQAGLYPNPIVGYHATEIRNLGTAGQQGGFISQRFITGGKRQLDQAIAGKDIDEEHFRFHAQEQRVLSDVRVRFYAALAAQQRLELTQELARLGDNLVEATETLLAGRLGTENDLLQAQIKADEAHILYDNARNQTVESGRRLAAAIGIPTMQMTPLAGELAGELSTIAWEECYRMVLGCNPELNAANTRMERASIAIQRARREPLPNVDLAVSVRHHNVTQSDVANVQVGVPIPIFNRNQGNIRSAEAAWMAAKNEVKRIELDLHDRLAVAYRRYANAAQQADRYSQRMVPRAKKSLELVTSGYARGQVKYLTLLTAQETYLQVSLAHLDSLRELRASFAVIEGQLLSGSLTQSPKQRPYTSDVPL